MFKLKTFKWITHTLVERQKKNLSKIIERSETYQNLHKSWENIRDR